ncbi:hypothetical protein HOP50_03g26890 [Chloropicon primus]|uniref:Secreted protein n=1 Tax=Chloropicon primus TaxID=1764295 RepID=A0A5B8MIP7_9CHLO|nr:hypothetical protein A3770_03p26890 [Chloropicon primus]UPQ99382.1 hypothetical protein HOP50_03g26890 [Chloropicon primus]|eukprot:QDZ20171.1 hypothetical protein A3770_03p26890 [Chloropicon primus]
MTAFSASTGRRKKTLWILAAVAALLLSSALAAEKPDDDYEDEGALGALDSLPTASASIDAEVRSVRRNAEIAEAVEEAIEEIAGGFIRNLGEGLLESDPAESSWS